MKESVIKSYVSIGDRVFLVIKDFLPAGYHRYVIEETYVTDLSANHGFVIGLDESIWRDCDEVGNTIFFTLDAAMKSIRNADDYVGFCFNAADGSKWIFVKRNG